MSCELKSLISIFILSAIALHIDFGSFSTIPDRETAVHSGESRTYREVDFVSAASSNGDHNKALPRQEENDMNKSPWRPNGRLSTDLHSQNGFVDGFQGDAPAFEGPGIPGKMYGLQSMSSSQATDVWLAIKPMVQCSGGVMTLTVDGKEYTHILVDRENAAPVPLFQLPAQCGYSIRMTRKGLVLMASFDGCYITQENGNYVLSLVWWGIPINISCPITRTISQPTPSVWCSNYGMVIKIEDAREAVENQRAIVSGEVLPLLSETCAYRIHSPPEVVMLYTAFNSKCVTVTDEETILVVILDGKQFTLSCPSPHHLPPYHPYLHSPFHQPLQPDQEQIPFMPYVPAFPAASVTIQQPTKPKPETPKPPVQIDPDTGLIIQPHLSLEGTYPIHPSIYQYQKPSAPMYSMFPYPYPASPADTPPHFGSYPIYCPPYLNTSCAQYPFLYHYYYPLYHQAAVTTASEPIIQPMPETASLPQPTYKPLTPPVGQISLLPQLPTFPPDPLTEPPKMSQSLNCTKNRLMAALPSAKMDSIKVKDLKTNTWVSIASVPAACNYIVHLRDSGVVLSSPLPGCHTQKLSSSVISLSIRFWDSTLLRRRTLQLRCHYITAPTVADKPLHQIIPYLTTIPTPARQPPNAKVLCSSQYMTVTLPPGPTSGLTVEAHSSGIKTQTEAVALLEAPSHCGYSVTMDKDGAINILIPYSACHMTQQDGEHKIILKYQTMDGRTIESLLSCQASFSQECDVAIEQRLVCGSGTLASEECQDQGCCYHSDTQLCYYPMDECTVDRHFVFSVRSSIVDPPLSPASLVTAGKSSCTPHKVTADMALFKIPLDECGVHRYVVGKTVIYLVEILNRVQPISLNYGTITRDSPVRILVECRYYPGSVVSVGYLVKSPSLGPSIKAQGVFGVQLRIAKDERYNSFYPQYHRPHRMLLGKPLYLEVRLLNPPDPTAMLLVHYCLAYPRSANSTWILIYDGCPNFLDKTPTHKPPATPAEALTSHVRRFTITTFQFLSEDDSVQSDEEIYFMCSTEVCLPSDGLCVEGCFRDPSYLEN